MNRFIPQVEAIVGPLRASERRKDRIREELLVHLELACEDARDRGSADPETTALARFGAIDAVRAEIQESVPEWERLLWAPVKVTAAIDVLFLHDPVKDRTPLRYAARRAVAMTSMLAVVCAVTIVITTGFAPPRGGFTAGIGELAAIFGELFASSLFTFYVVETTGMRVKLDLRDGCSAGLHMLCVGLFALLQGGSFLGAVLLLQDSQQGRALAGWVASWSPASAAMLLGAMAAGLALTWKEAKIAKERHRRWGTTPTIAE